ncbi:CarboxypepD_reg-like domain-containing protein [Lutibacter agarilyticus]|uniref:CarboxypepD_reg-like domain-containing protein n=1 Tax=Lutibacter agarilyticus TaxID=1109740 RepID=A0A238YHZ4_9FLAO|nr:carboxypeptidase-like regulatory domain-containing protein [Lutibacter agarilyticus]SNR70244.1 CarboxypepD_reg-like domain-containing protein [Lutibacter agarilyticus]
MRNLTKTLLKRSLTTSVLCFIFFIAIHNNGYATSKIVNDTIGFNSYKGIIVEANSKKPLEFASLNVNGTNISTVSNSKGEFLLKVPKKFQQNSVTVSFLGYTSKVLSLSEFNDTTTIIQLETYIEELSEISIAVKDAPTLVKEVLKRRTENYSKDHLVMTAFYREAIKKRKTYVSLSEAIIEINKQPYTNDRNDVLQLYKSRKSTDYNKLDTVALKHRGGAHSMVRLDVMKNPELLLTEDVFQNYKFKFENSTKIDNRVIYVVNFKPNQSVEDALFYGKLYIDAQSLALVSAKFELDLSDIDKAKQFFILKKPARADVTPILAKYQVDYRKKGNKWYHNYSRIELGFKINWEKKWFNSIYYSTTEMAITDWHKVTDPKNIKQRDRLKSSVILSDEASGFSDPEFWGEYNLIEPEKPIHSAIKKIQKQLKKI